MPGSALVVIEPELVLRGLKTILDRPPMTLDRYQRFERRSRWTPSGANAAPDGRVLFAPQAGLIRSTSSEVWQRSTLGYLKRSDGIQRGGLALQWTILAATQHSK